MVEHVVGIVGAGTMGAGIAQVALESGWTVRIGDVDARAVDRARARIRDGLARRAAKVQPGSPDGWVAERAARLRSASVEQVADGAELVIEAAIEDLAVKRELFRALDLAAEPSTILATNTSALSVDRVAEATRRPGRIVGLHFFNPAPLLPLVEVVAGPRTFEAVASRAAAIVTSWGKTAIRCADSPGFIVNRVNRPFTLEALRLLRANEASIEDIDAAMEDAGFPMGPFRLMDLIGIDVNLAAARGLFEGSGRAPRFRPSPIQETLVGEGHLGRKTGEGFYRYDEAGAPIGVARGLAVSLQAGDRPTSDAIAERIVLAIVNEAYRALGDHVASAEDIDRAMKLGANHPFGPFEWAARTGLAETATMLDALSDDDPDTFRPAMALLRAVGAELLARSPD
jgi:3-hydroxybutyryl-CoA dehydrogenase